MVKLHWQNLLRFQLKQFYRREDTKTEVDTIMQLLVLIFHEIYFYIVELLPLNTRTANINPV